MASYKESAEAAIIKCENMIRKEKGMRSLPRIYFPEIGKKSYLYGVKMIMIIMV